MGQGVVLDLLAAPALQFRGQVAVRAPPGGEGETALWMIGGAQAVKAPKGAGQNAIGEFIAFAPPLVPDPPDVMVGAGLRAGQIRGKQAADTQEPRLKGEGIGPAQGPSLAQFGQALHGPDVVLVAKGAEQTLPERLFPTGVAGAGLEPSGLALETNMGGLVEQVAQRVSTEVAQGRTALATQLLRQRLRSLTAQPQAQFTQRRIQRLAQSQHRRAA